jgi:hypothetical protein
VIRLLQPSAAAAASMLNPNDLSPVERRHFYRRAALAPLCLCLVAGLHVVRVWTCRQTPWKGGGFGMFSTIDDESARFLRCYLVTDHGDLPLAIPATADKAVAELRAAPTPAKLDELARRLADQSWRWRNERQANEVAAIRRHDGIAISAAVLNSAASGVERSSNQTSSGHGTLEPIPRGEPAVGAVSFRAVRIACLRYRYDATNRTLGAETILVAEAVSNGALLRHPQPTGEPPRHAEATP